MVLDYLAMYSAWFAGEMANSQHFGLISLLFVIIKMLCGLIIGVTVCWTPESRPFGLIRNNPLRLVPPAIILVPLVLIIMITIRLNQIYVHAYHSSYAFDGYSILCRMFGETVANLLDHFGQKEMILLSAIAGALLGMDSVNHKEVTDEGKPDS